MRLIHLRCQISSEGFDIFFTFNSIPDTVIFKFFFSVIDQEVDVGTRSVIELMIELVINTVRLKPRSGRVFEGQILSRHCRGLLVESRSVFICLVALINRSYDGYMFSNTV